MKEIFEKTALLNMFLRQMFLVLMILLVPILCLFLGPMIFKKIKSVSLHNFAMSLILPFNFQNSQTLVEPLPIPPQTIQRPPLEDETVQRRSLDIESKDEQVALVDSLLLNDALTDKQDLIDDILEKIDILQRQIADLETEELLKNKKEENDDEGIEPIEEKIPAVETAIFNKQKNNGNPTYPKLLISEIQIGSEDDAKEEFTELYNPNNFNVDLTGWYIHRKTKNGSDYSTFAANTLFTGKNITANGYFLIARQDYFTSIADVFIDNPLTEDNSLILKNPNGEIVDKVGWGEVQDFETSPALNHLKDQSLGRKTTQSIQGLALDEQDTDNNSSDFEVGNSTPRAKNESYTEPVLPIQQNILINEIQIDSIDGVGGTDDDWIELYNPNDTDVLLNGWSIQKHSSDDPCSLDKSFSKKNFDENYKIPAKGFFMISATDSSDLLKDIADMTIGWSLSNNNTVYLVRSNEKILDGDDEDIIDKVGFGEESCFSENIPAIEPVDGKSIRRKLDGDDSDNNFNDFEVQNPTPKENNFINLDTTPPLRSNGSPKGELVSGTVETNISLDTDEISSCKYSTIENQNYETMTEEFSTTNSMSHSILVTGLTNDNNYNYYIKCIDQLGNKNTDDFIISFSVAPETPEISVAINEIAWMGSENSANDEWIELKNNTGVPINLLGWILKAFDESPIINLLGFISASGFYLLERTNDDPLPNIIANQIYTGVLENDGEDLYLYDERGNLVDRIDCSSGWFGGNNDLKKTMERKDSLSDGNDSNNWRTSENIGGSPGS